MAERYTAEQVDGEISYLELRAKRLELDLQQGLDDAESVVTMSAMNHLIRATAMLRQYAADLRAVPRDAEVAEIEKRHTDWEVASVRSVDEITIHLVANHGYGALKDRAALLAKLKSAKPRLTRKQFEKLLQKLCAEVAGGCFYVGPGDGEQGECADGDCYCSKTVKQHVEDFIKAGVEVQE